MAKATWNGVVLAESDSFETVEGNIYFPLEAINRTYFKESEHTSFCPWKGAASYFTLVVGVDENQDAAWYYTDPKDAAANIRDHVAFWRGVEVES
ncbi:MAG: DUF427 domain-containing protein [Alphaproteobacteria bacterium]